MARARPWLLALAATLALAAPAQAQLPYGQNNFGRFFHIIPPGQNGADNAAQAALFLTTGRRPPHNDDQRDMYTDLLYGRPGLVDSQIGRYFPDANFGVKPGDAERTTRPRSDVTVVRDGFGRPHIYGATREGTMFGAGYASAEDHLFFMDVLRHAGDGTLSSFAGGANAGMDRGTWQSGPYSDAERQRMLEGLARFGPDGRQVMRDIEEYVAGVNAFIAAARVNPALLPAEYPASLNPVPRPWTPVSVLNVATLIGAQLGKGGGDELSQAQLLLANMSRFGRKRGYRIWRALREVDDPEAPVTATRKRGFRYSVTPRKLRKSVALPDRGTLRPVNPVVASTGTGAKPASSRRLLQLPRSMSNALLVPARHSATGRPLSVMGSQAGYFTSEIWRYQELHGPGIHVAGANIPGTGPYVEIGHGPDYAWSATSASQDIIDVFAVPLCGDSHHYRFRGQCLAMERLERRNSWRPNAADTTAPGSETLVAERTKLGIVIARARVKGKPVAYTSLRSTYGHELDSALAFLDWNTPSRILSARDFLRSAFKLGYTFNWFYADNRNIAYINTGANPIRRKRVNGLLPVRASRKTEWKGFDPDTGLARYQSYRGRPKAIDQDLLVSWNNKQARHCCGNGPHTPVHRSQPLVDAIKAQYRKHGGRITLANLVDAAQFGATVDLRGYKLALWALRAIGTPKDASLARAVNLLRAWARRGAHRVDRNRDGRYEDAEAVRIMDAWMRTMPRAVFEPRLGNALFKRYDEALAADTPNTFHTDLHSHLGSAWEGGWFGYLQKDIRTVLNRKKVRGRWPIRFCGYGKRSRCRRVLRGSLRAALAISADRLYSDPTVAGSCGIMDQQACYDSISFRPVTAITQPLIPWQNRPTQQQVAEVTGHR